MHKCLFAPGEPLVHVWQADVQATRTYHSQADQGNQSHRIAPCKYDHRVEYAVKNASDFQHPFPSNSVCKSRHGEQGKALRKGKASAEYRSLPGGLAREIEALNPIVERPAVRVVDLPRQNSLITIADVVESADFCGVAAALSQLTAVYLALDEVRNLVVKPSEDTIHTSAYSKVYDDNLEPAEPACLFHNFINKLIIALPA